VTLTESQSKLIRRNRRLGVAMLGIAALLVAVSVVSGEALSLSSWSMLGFIAVTGVLQLSTARLLRLERDDPAGNERRERRFEAAAIVLGVGLPLVALVAVLALAVVILVR